MSDQGQGSYNTLLHGQRLQKGWKSIVAGGKKGLNLQKGTLSM